MFDVEKIRKDFPILNRTISGKPIIYFDSAATSQKPYCVINTLTDFYSNYNANIHRGVHKLSQESSELYEKAHDKAAKFINARDREEVVFTRNTTESINLVANGLGLKKGDEVFITEMEHHSNIVPWLMLRDKAGIVLRYISVKENGELDIEKFEKEISERTKLVSCVHVSNFLGTINPVEQIGKIAKKYGAKFMVDGAQSAPHMPVDVKRIGCDFFAFSSHKMCGPTGIGVLYGKKEQLNEMPPFLGGGDMILEVSYDKFKPNVLPWKFEAGTANIADGYAFGIALDYLKKIGMNNIFKHDQELISYALEKIKEVPDIRIYGPTDAKKRGGLVAFNVGKINPHDVAALLDERANVMIRSGHHCVMPLHKKLGISGSARASFYLYNTKQEIDVFIENLKEIARTLK
jgi:cysteine desulfurase/selenocysteine lyase